MRMLLLSMVVLAGCAHAPAPADSGSERRVSLDLELSYAHAAFAEIARKSGANVVYHGSNERTVTLALHDAPWRDAVEAVAKACDLAVDWQVPGIVLITDR